VELDNEAFSSYASTVRIKSTNLNARQTVNTDLSINSRQKSFKIQFRVNEVSEEDSSQMGRSKYTQSIGSTDLRGSTTS